MAEVTYPWSGKEKWVRLRTGGGKGGGQAHESHSFLGYDAVGSPVTACGVSFRTITGYVLEVKPKGKTCPKCVQIEAGA